MKIGYARISTDEQNADLQLNALKKVGCEKIFKDYGVSGAKGKRTGLDELLKTIKPDDVLIVWKLDRLGRSLSFLIKLLDEFNKKDIGFRSITESIDTTSSIGKLIFHMIGAIAEFERDLIAERTREGMKAAKARGSKIGRPRKLNHEQINQVKTLYETHHLTYTEIALEFNVDRTTISRALGKLTA